MICKKRGTKQIDCSPWTFDGVP